MTTQKKTLAANKQTNKEGERDNTQQLAGFLQASASWEAKRMKYASHQTKRTETLSAGKL